MTSRSSSTEISTTPTFACTSASFARSRKVRWRTIYAVSPYVLDLDEIARRTEEAWNRGATEVCLQGGIHPAFTGETYLDICRAVKQAAPGIHVHAFSPLEIMHGAQTLGVSIVAFLSRLIEAGTGEFARNRGRDSGR